MAVKYITFSQANTHLHEAYVQPKQSMFSNNRKIRMKAKSMSNELPATGLMIRLRDDFASRKCHSYPDLSVTYNNESEDEHGCGKETFSNLGAKVSGYKDILQRHPTSNDVKFEEEIAQNFNSLSHTAFRTEESNISHDSRRNENEFCRKQQQRRSRTFFSNGKLLISILHFIRIIDQSNVSLISRPASHIGKVF